MSISNQETVHEGWLTKSPPTKRIWRARWRRRWFALRQSGELPGQYFLEYYTDRNCRKLKGTIDLDQCEQVDAGLRFERRKQKYQFMFDVKTPARTYYLAADNEADMNRWVDCICHVCGLKADEEVVSTTPDYYNCGPGAVLNAPQEADIIDSRMSPTPSTASGPYIPISECRSGPPLPSPLSPEEMSSLLAGYTNDLSPLSPTSIPPSYAETLNSYDPRFYDSPCKIRPVSNLNLHLNDISNNSTPLTNNNNQSIQQSNSIIPEWSNKTGKMKTRPPDLVLGADGCSPGHSPTDSESVFTEDEWTHPVLPLGTEGPRPSDSSVENETVPWSVVQRFSKMASHLNEEILDTEIFEINTETHVEPPTPPPRPPKPTHFHELPPHGYQNLDGLDKSSDFVIYSNRDDSSFIFGPRTASTIVADDFYDIPRSHQPSIDIESTDHVSGKHCYTNAAPSEICDTSGKTSFVFRYDFDSQNKLEDVDKRSYKTASPSTPITPDTPISTTESISNSIMSNVTIGIGDEPASPDSRTDSQVGQEKSSPAPVVNRCLKPRRKTSPPPSIDRKLKPPTPLNSRAATRTGTMTPSSLSFDKPHSTISSALLQDMCSYEGVSLRRQRAAPSPTPPRQEGGSDEDNTAFTDEQIFFYTVGDKFIPITPPGSNFETLQYLDLDLNSDTNLSVPRSPGPSTVYKTVDFLKTEAFKRTRQTAEASRTEKQQKELHKE